MRRGKFKILFYFVILVCLVFGIYMFLNSKLFERNAPKIEIEDIIYSNLKTPLPVYIKDDSGIKFVEISLYDGNNKTTIYNENFTVIAPEQRFELKFPKGMMVNKNANYEIEIKATDNSKWNFTMGNTSIKRAKIIIDNKKPFVEVIGKSYKISKGGSAVVVFKANDEMLKDVYIKTNYGKNFIPVKFIKDGFYASLVAWPANQNEFSADIVAVDVAGNESISRIRYFYQDKNYKISNIKLNENFINGKVSDLADTYAQNSDELKGVDKFKFVNETLRGKNEELIYSFSSKVPEKELLNFKISPFYPLKNAAAVASFGDHRIYSWEDNQISESWHLGLDLASVANAEIINSNDGVVVFSGENGIYGLNIGVYYGFGLYAIYGHCSASNFTEGTQIKAGEILGKTGSSGFAFGDHLHFGVLVQGVEVRPEEWMDEKWMKENIYDILENSKEMIRN